MIIFIIDHIIYLKLGNNPPTVNNYENWLLIYYENLEKMARRMRKSLKIGTFKYRIINFLCENSNPPIKYTPRKIIVFETSLYFSDPNHLPHPITRGLQALISMFKSHQYLRLHDKGTLLTIGSYKFK